MSEAGSNDTFMTGLPTIGDQDNSQINEQHNEEVIPVRLSDEEMIAAVERRMLELEADSKYLEAERERRHLEALKRRQINVRLQSIHAMHSEDVQVFFNMVQQHQENFDKTWHKRALEHKVHF